MVATSVQVSLGLGHAMVVNLRTTFRLRRDSRRLSEPMH